jgi:hypothetical protein
MVAGLRLLQTVPRAQQAAQSALRWCGSVNRWRRQSVMDGRRDWFTEVRSEHRV